MPGMPCASSGIRPAISAIATTRTTSVDPAALRQRKRPGRLPRLKRSVLGQLLVEIVPRSRRPRDRRQAEPYCCTVTWAVTENQSRVHRARETVAERLTHDGWHQWRDVGV